jgi:type VI secretion system secreted protein Hcp
MARHRITSTRRRLMYSPGRGGMSNAGSAHAGGGAGAGKVNVQDLTFTKWVDKATPKLALACCSGQHFKDATLVVRKAGEKPVEYLKIKMDVVFIGSISTGGSGGARTA